MSMRKSMRKRRRGWIEQGRIRGWTETEGRDLDEGDSRRGHMESECVNRRVEWGGGGEGMSKEGATTVQRRRRRRKEKTKEREDECVSMRV